MTPPLRPRILLTGHRGQVGFELRRALAPFADLLCPGRDAFDLNQPARLAGWLDLHQPDLIINPAAYTAVDRAEDDVAEAYRINTEAVAAMADWAARHNRLLVHYSTDYIFDGNLDRAWREEDAANPLSVYGHSKWQGEEAIRQSGCRHFILRTAWVAGVHGQNFLKTMLRLACSRDSLSVVADQFGSPTSASLLADMGTHLLLRSWQDPAQPYGTYHVASRGETSWHGYACHLIDRARAAGWPVTLKDAPLAIPSSAYPQKAHRPARSTLDCDKLTTTFGMALPDWQTTVDQLFDYLDSARRTLP